VTVSLDVCFEGPVVCGLEDSDSTLESRLLRRERGPVKVVSGASMFRGIMGKSVGILCGWYDGAVYSSRFDDCDRLHDEVKFRNV